LLNRAVGDDARSIALVRSCYLGNKTVSAVAQAMGVSPTALRMRLARMRAAARARSDGS
jgi:transposase-like protein